MTKNSKQITDIQAFAAGDYLVELMSVFVDIPVTEFYKNNRGTENICTARQMAMYLLHVCYSASYEQVGKHFSRNRTTVSHACALIEDRRDYAPFEKDISRLERLINWNKNKQENAQ